MIDQPIANNVGLFGEKWDVGEIAGSVVAFRVLLLDLLVRLARGIEALFGAVCHLVGNDSKNLNRSEREGVK